MFFLCMCYTFSSTKSYDMAFSLSSSPKNQEHVTSKSRLSDQKL